MEILRGTIPVVRFYLPSGDSNVSTATYRLNDATTETPISVTQAAGVASATLPYLQSEGTAYVTWNFNTPGGSFSETEQYDIITPLLTVREVQKIVTGATEEEALDIEKAVRHIIAAHTGQNFGKFVGKLKVSGSGDGTLRMPRRLITLTSVNDNLYWSDVLALRGGGWFLTKKHLGAPPVRADFHGFHYHPNSGVITPPDSYASSRFVKHYEYEIDGVWGWDHVPEPVKEAAKLLVNDYACGDSIYRDRFLTSMTAADWRIQFHEGAFSNTGNVRANQLLADYRLRRGWVVL